MSIRDLMAKSSLGRGSLGKEKAQQLNWKMTTPDIPGVDDDSLEKPIDPEQASSIAEITPADLSDTEVLDNFLLAFFALWPQDSKPSDSQLHHLAETLGVAPEVLEEHIYNMLGRIADSDEIDAQDI